MVRYSASWPPRRSSPGPNLSGSCGEEAEIPDGDEPLTGIVRLLIPLSDERTRREYDSLGLEIGCRVSIRARLKVSWATGIRARPSSTS